MGLADGYMLGHAAVGHVIRRAGLFEAANVPFMMQNTGGNITRAFVVHMAAAFDRATLHHVTGSNLWEEDVVRPAFEVIDGHVAVPEKPGLGMALDRDGLERLKAATPEPAPKALIRIQCENGPNTFARPPLSRHPHLQPNMVPTVGEGYDLRVNQDYWFDDGSKEFNELWAITEQRAVSR